MTSFYDTNTGDQSIPTSENMSGEHQNILRFAAVKRKFTISAQKLTEDRWLKNRTDRYEDFGLLMRRK